MNILFPFRSKNKDKLWICYLDLERKIYISRYAWTKRSVFHYHKNTILSSLRNKIQEKRRNVKRCQKEFTHPLDGHSTRGIQGKKMDKRIFEKKKHMDMTSLTTALIKASTGMYSPRQIGNRYLKMQAFQFDIIGHL